MWEFALGIAVGYALRWLHVMFRRPSHKTMAYARQAILLERAKGVADAICWLADRDDYPNTGYDYRRAIPLVPRVRAEIELEVEMAKDRAEVEKLLKQGAGRG